jgi:hypothetical protein
LTSKLGKIKLNAESLEKKMAVPDYSEKVKEEVRQANDDKVSI